MGSNDPPIPKAVEIVSQAWQSGKPLAAQMGGVFTLGAAGVLKGKQFACQPGDAHWIPDGIYAGSGVVVDGKVATSGTCPYMAKALNKPDGTAELTKKFIALIQ
jgi:putative intracellular protease/amidase